SNDAGRAAGELRRAALLLIAKAAVAILTVLDVLRAALDRGLGHVESGIAGSAQGHDLADRHRHISIAAARMIAPATLNVLVFPDQFERALESVFETVA